MCLYSIPVKATASSINLFIQHYYSKGHEDITLRASLQGLQTELGVTGKPLTYDYDVWGNLATD